MLPVIYDIKIYKGQTYAQTFTFKTSGQTPTPISLSGMTVKSQIRPSENSQVLTTEFVVSKEDEAGIVHLALSSEQTAALPVGIQFYDLKIVDSYNTVNYWVKGKIYITGRVTE